jgi:DtxR family Mn-dependent transcriptional regulator
MLVLTYTEENYLKAIYSIGGVHSTGEVSVNEIAERMQTRPATVTDMLRKLSEKGLINYEKYKKITLSKVGAKMALGIVRKHRLWESFLYSKLNFSWDEVHEVAEQLEHIQSTKLMERLDEFLGYPEYDPHGDPIPKPNGEMPKSTAQLLSEKSVGANCKIVAVKDTNTAFLQQLERIGLKIGSKLTVSEIMPYDKSMVVKNDAGKSLQLSHIIATNLLVL